MESNTQSIYCYFPVNNKIKLLDNIIINDDIYCVNSYYICDPKIKGYDKTIVVRADKNQKKQEGII